MATTDNEFTTSDSSDVDLGDSAKHHQPESTVFNVDGLREQMPEVETVYFAEDEQFSQVSEHTEDSDDSEDTEDLECSEDSDDSVDIERRLMEEALNAPLPDSDDDSFLDDDEPSSNEALAPADADGKQRSQVEIGKDGSFNKKRVKVFFNSARQAARRDAHQKQQRREEGETEIEEEEEEENYMGREFTGAGYADFEETVELDFPRRQFEPRQYEPRPYRHYQYRGFRRNMRYIPCAELLNTEDAEAFLKDASRFEFIDPKFINQNQYAMPDEMIWTTLGKSEEYLTEGYVCPRGKDLVHHPFTKEQREQERFRNGLIYQLICENGPLHVEDLWKALLDRMTRDPFPFDGFFGFYRYVSDRSHLFLIDSQRMVFNQNLLVTVAVMRYAHSLYHSTPIEMTPKLFKSERGSLFFRAFLSTSTRDELSFDRFFPSFPAIFKYDEEWKLNTPSVESIPSVFDPYTLPRRIRTEQYVDRSITFSGTGKVTANSVSGIKIESEETLRKGMTYYVQVPPEIVGDKADMYPICSRVAYTGVRCYNGWRFSVMATSIALQPEEKEDFDGTLDDFWSCDTEEKDQPVEMEIKETPSTVVRVLDERSKMAEREKEINEALLKFEEEPMVVMWNRTHHLFDNEFNQFKNHIAYRPFYFKIVLDGQNHIIYRRSQATTKAMIELLGKLEGKDGRSVTTEDAKEMYARTSLTLAEEDQFAFEELSDVLAKDKLLFTDNGKPRLVIKLRPLIHWDPEHKVMMRI